MTRRRSTHQQILDAFGVTEDDLAALNAADGYLEAREQARRERAAFIEHIKRTTARVEAELSVRWGDDPQT